MKSNCYLVAVLTLFFSYPVVVSAQSIDTDMLCVGDHWTEEEGATFLQMEKEKYSTEKEWDKRAVAIRKQILKGTGLNKMPKSLL